MELPIYQVDAFSTEVFRGNPAAVCPLREWLPASTMQAIAMENNLSETVFFVGENSSYEIRWFTPTVEARLCGHATLAAAFVIFRFIESTSKQIRFQSHLSGPLSVERRGDLLELDFPIYSRKKVKALPYYRDALGFDPKEVWEGENGMRFAVCDSAEIVRALKPKLAVLEEKREALCVTAPGEGCDYVYRYFDPADGIPEDPVTGSANCILAPYWSERFGKSEMVARQLSKRGGELQIELKGDRVKIAGRGVLYLEGRIRV